MSSKVLLITEVDLDDFEMSVIGVADSKVNAEKMIQEYYGDFVILERLDIDDWLTIVSRRIFEVYSYNNEPYKVEVILSESIVNEI